MERWKISRAGVINFWYYDDEEFIFEDGRLLLRGANGSGKSVTMQSLVPLLFDGNKSPERLDPFGSRARKMDSYLLSDGLNLEERTGYLFLEFNKAESQRYKTIGMGMRARKNMPTQTWYFIVNDNRRVGIKHELSLYKNIGEKLPLTQKQLENKLGEGGNLYTRQKDYKAAVNEQLFGYNDLTDFEELIELLIQLRSPKLSKEFKPTTMYEIMQNSLFTLTEDDLRPMSEAIESMDEVKEKIDSLLYSKKALDKIYSSYNKYNQYVLAYKAKSYEEYLNEKKINTRKIENLKKNLITEERKLRKNEEKIINLTEEEVILRQKENQLREDDLSKLAEEKLEVENEIESLKGHIIKKQTLLEKYLDEEKELILKKSKQEEEMYFIKKNIKNSFDDLREYSALPKYDECEFMISDYENNPNEFNFNYYKDHLNKYRNKVKVGLDSIRVFEKVSDFYNEILEKKDRKLKELDSQNRKAKEYENLFNSIKEEYAENVISWNAHNQILNLEKPIINKVVERVFQFGDLYSFEEVKEPILNGYMVFMNEHNKKISSIQGKQINLNILLNEKKEKMKEIIGRKEPEPDRSEAVKRNRKKLKEMKISFIPLYQALDFQSGLDEQLKNNLEEALLELGLLDALIIDPKFKDKVLDMPLGNADKYIFSKPNILSLNISEYLKVDKSVNIKTSLIIDVIQSIFLDNGTDLFISKDGKYGHGILLGKVSGTYTSKFISYLSRKKYKEEQIESIKLDIENIKYDINELDKEIKEIKDILFKGEAEFKNIPSKVDIKTAFDDYKEEGRILKTTKYDYEQLLDRVELSYKELNEAKIIRHDKTHDLYLTLSVKVFEETIEDLDSYKESLFELITFSQKNSSVLLLIESIDYSLEQCLENSDDTRYDLGDNERVLRKNLSKLDTIIEQLGVADYNELLSQLSSIRERLKIIPFEIKENYLSKSNIQTEINKTQSEIENKIEVIENSTKKLMIFEWALKSEWDLGFTELSLDDDNINTISQHVLLTYGTILDEGKNVVELREILNRKFHEEQGMLVEYNMKMTSLFKNIPFDDVDENDLIHIERTDITSRMQGKTIKFNEMIKLMHDQIETNQHVLDEQDRMLFEEILIKSISRKISSKIYHSEKWVAEIDKLMSEMNTSSGLKFNLRWITKNATSEDQLSTRELVTILKGDQSILTKTQRERLIQHFRSKINESKNRLGTDDHRSFLAIMKDVLDYRKWFEFQLYYTKPGDNKKELTNNAFFTFSGGEKAMAMYVPLFSAVYAKYQSGASDCPKVISLDEAFAGVDDKNIKDMFKLLVELDLGFIANSQVLFGDFETVPSLGIYELIRPENVTFVTLIRYLWNGKSRQMVNDHE